MEPFEFIGAFATIMFILSLATERLANLLKISLSRLSIPFPIWVGVENWFFQFKFVPFFSNLSDRNDNDKQEEKRREGRIIVLNITLGFIIALMFNADVFVVADAARNRNEDGTVSFGQYEMFSADDKVIEKLKTFSSNHRELLPSDYEVESYPLYVKFVILYFKPYDIHVCSYFFLFLLSLLLPAIPFYYLLNLYANRLLDEEKFGEFSSERNSKDGKRASLAFLLFLLALLLINGVFFNSATSIFTKFFGLLITAAFLSMGSKFWHDVLDIIFSFKRLDGKLTDQRVYATDNVADRLELINTTDRTIAELALEQNEQTLRNRFGNEIANIQVGATANGRLGIIVNFKGKLPGSMPSTVNVELPSGQITTVELEAIEKNQEVKICASVQSLRMGKRYKSYLGSAGVIIRRNNKRYLLTCSHVVFWGSGKNRNGDLSSPETNIALDGRFKLFSGKAVYAKIDNDNDTALVEFQSTVINQILNKTPKSRKLKKHKELKKENENDEVFFYSARDKRLRSGKIHVFNYEEEVKINYDRDKDQSFTGLIKIGKPYEETVNGSVVMKWRTISKKGDSGSVIYDANYHPIALLIAGDDQFTYGLHISKILNQITAEIFTN